MKKEWLIMGGGTILGYLLAKGISNNEWVKIAGILIGGSLSAIVVKKLK